MKTVQPSRRPQFALARAASALLVALLLGSCGRGPLTPPPPVSTVPTITFQLYVAGAITPAQGNYIITVNAVTAAGTDVNFASFGEPTGMPTAQEATAGSWTHWDQEFVYGCSTTNQSFGFNYAYKVNVVNTVSFPPIILTSNQFIFTPNASSGSGVGNTLSITLPIAQLSIRSNPGCLSPPCSTTTTPAATTLYVNYITTDNSGCPLGIGAPQDQLGPQGLNTPVGGYTLFVDLTTAHTYFNQLTVPPGVGAQNGNANLSITGGQIIVSP